MLNKKQGRESAALFLLVLWYYFLYNGITMAVQKTSVSFDPSNWKRLSKAANKSKIVNEALHLYFLVENMQAEKESSWSDEEMALLQREWDHYKKTGESFSYEETFDRLA